MKNYKPFTYKDNDILIGKAILHVRPGFNNKIVKSIVGVDKGGVYIPNFTSPTSSYEHITFEDLLNNYRFVDDDVEDDGSDFNELTCGKYIG